MAIIQKIILEKNDRIVFRSGDVISDVIIEKDFFQLRSYAKHDLDRSNGSKQNIQLSKPIAKELIKLLNEFVQ